jgi:glucose-6-phosphate 1-epimerase
MSSHISAHTSQQGLQYLYIENAAACATLYLQGAHLTSFIPKGQSDQLWVSEAEPYLPGTALRGGIPICWPWFGPHPQSTTLPSHGLVRTRLWNWNILEDDTDVSRLRLWVHTDGQDAGFPHRASAELTVSIAATLKVTLTTTNQGDKALPLSQALHTYLPIKAPETLVLSGLAGLPYLDKLTGERHHWPDTFVLDREIDRIVFDQGQNVSINDIGGPRRIVKRAGSRSLVVWNPWLTKSRTLSNFKDTEYRNMLCLETANAGDDRRLLQPGEQHSLSMELAIQSPNDA